MEVKAIVKSQNNRASNTYDTKGNIIFWYINVKPDLPYSILVTILKYTIEIIYHLVIRI